MKDFCGKCSGKAKFDAGQSRPPQNPLLGEEGKREARGGAPASAASRTVAMATSRLQVECYAGYRADERPLRFRFAAAPEKTLEVQEVLDQWYSVGYRSFRVRANDHNLYVLHHDEQEDIWTLDSFQRNEFLP